MIILTEFCFLDSRETERKKKMVNRIVLEKLMLLSIFTLLLIGLLNSLFLLSDNNVAISVFGLYAIFKGNRLVLLAVRFWLALDRVDLLLQ